MRSTGRLARLQREFDPTAQLPLTVVVLPLDSRTTTSSVTATLALLMQATLPHPVVAVDADGMSQPLRKLLSSSGAGDLIGLAASHDASLKRARVIDYLDMAADVPLATCWLDGPGAIPPDSLRSAAWKLKRRFPSMIVDVPRGVPKSTIAVATALATHILLVGDPDDLGHGWLHEGKSILARSARRNAVTIAALGGTDAVRTQCAHGDIVPVPQLQSTGYRTGSVELPDDPDDLLAYAVLLRRVCASATVDGQPDDSPRG